jgi:very-short-patch-repair endonuclease
MRQESATPDMVIAQTAARQHGVVSFEQLLAAGVSASGISRRVSKGRLHRVFRGVYAVGHTRLSSEGRWMAAALACGKAASLSQRSAAELWALLPPRNGPIDITIPGTDGRRKRRGIRLHRSRLLTPAVTTLRDGIAVTTPARTLADLRRVATPDDFGRAIRQAEVLGLPIGDQIVANDLTRSELERRFLWLCRRHRLPTPEVNVRVGPFIVDFLWRDKRLIAETDGYRFHRGRSAFEGDRARDVELKLRGYEVVRFTYRQVVEQALPVARTLRVLLA